ncbi:MAG: tetratricopeptide repeat protein [Cyanobacteria bacterium J06623_7]
MNSTLKYSNLVPLNITPEKKSQLSEQSLSLISSVDRSDKPSIQQKQAIAKIYIAQAEIYFQEKNWRDAIAACKNALNVNPQDTDAYKIFGNILRIRGKKAAALGIYAKALEIAPNSAAIYANLGSFYAEQKNWQQALDYYQQAVIIDPNLAGAYRSLARVWEELGKTEQALECLCLAVNLEPEQLDATEYFNFGDLLYQQQKLKEASIFYIQGVELAPQAERLAKLVKILEELEDWQQAVEFYHRLISLSNGESAQNRLAATKPIRNLLSKSKLATKSKSRTQQPVKTITPANNSAPKLLAESKTESAATSIALPTADKKPSSASSWNNLGSSYAQKQQWLKAISCYQESIELNPKLSKTHRNLARVYAKVGKQEQAVLSWYRAFRLSPSSVKPKEHFALAQKLVRLQQIDKAIECLRHSLEQNPGYQPARLLMERLKSQNREQNLVSAP